MKHNQEAEKTPTAQDWQELAEEKMGDQTGVIDGQLMAQLRAHPELHDEDAWQLPEEPEFVLEELPRPEPSMALSASVLAVGVEMELEARLPARAQEPEPTGVMNPAQRDALARMTGTDGDADLMTSAPRLPMPPLHRPIHTGLSPSNPEVTPSGLPCGPGEAELGAGQMQIEQRALAPMRPEPTLHLNQSDILVSEPDHEMERTIVAPARQGPRKKSVEPEATMVPGKDFFDQLEQDRRRVGIKTEVAPRLEAASAPRRALDAPAQLQEQRSSDSVWAVVGVVLTVLVLLGILISWQGRW